jgi:hypothetical protein
MGGIKLGGAGAGAALTGKGWTGFDEFPQRLTIVELMFLLKNIFRQNRACFL